MNANVQELPPANKAARWTGFNEPFNEDRNTTLPHPDADLSPNACIEATTDFVQSTSRHRSLRLRLRSRKNSRSSRHGKLSTDSAISMGYDQMTPTPDEALEDDLEAAQSIDEAIVDGDYDPAVGLAPAAAGRRSASESSAALSSDGEQKEKKKRAGFWSRSSPKN